MAQNRLEEFYGSWSAKPPGEIEYDIEASFRKAEVLVSHIPADLLLKIRSILDYGCGYGGLLRRFRDRVAVTSKVAVGVDFSSSAIEVARQRFEDESLKYYKLPGLGIDANSEFLRATVPNGVDCILLVDLLEHVPDCVELLASLSRFTKFFVIKLPVESSVVDNYLLTKEYPSSVHSNGHLREFNANDVHYFVREIGLTPLFETLYVYHLGDMFPPLPAGCTLGQKARRLLVRVFKTVAMVVLPKKLFLRWIGGGGYFCIATFDEAHVLNP